MAGKILIADIQRAIAAEHRVPVGHMRAPDALGERQREISHPRQEAMELASLLTGLSYSRIGFFFGGRDHSTILSARKSVAKRRRSDPKVHERLRRVTLSLLAEARKPDCGERAR